MGGGERGVIRERSTKDFHVSGLDLGHTRETHSVFKNVVSLGAFTSEQVPKP